MKRPGDKKKNVCYETVFHAHADKVDSDDEDDCSPSNHQRMVAKARKQCVIQKASFSLPIAFGTPVSVLQEPSPAPDPSK